MTLDPTKFRYRHIGISNLWLSCAKWALFFTYNNIREGRKAERYTYPRYRFDSGDTDAWIGSEAKFKHIFKMHGTFLVGGQLNEIGYGYSNSSLDFMAFQGA